MTGRSAPLVLATIACHLASEPAVPAANWQQSETEQGYVVCSRSTLRPYYGGDVPARAEITPAVACRLARSEFEPVMIGVHAIGGPLTNIRLEVQTDLPAKVYRFLPNRRTEPGRGILEIPWFLVPESRIARIDQGRTGAFWIVLHADENAGGGDREGSVRVTVDGKPATTVKLAVHVRAITLPRPNIAFGMYASIHYFREDLRGEEYRRKYYRDMAEHGMTTCTVWPSSLAEFTEDTAKRTGHIRFDVWQATKDMEMMLEEGLIHSDIPAILVDGRISEADDKRQAAIDLREEGKKRGWPELLLYMRDEPHWRQFEELTRTLTPWKKIPEMRNVTAMNSQPPYGLGYLHDVWVVRNDEVTPEILKEARRLGAEVWTYAIDLACSNPLANRYYAGLYTWGFGLTGNTPWGYHDTRQLVLQDDGTASTYPANGFILPGKDGPNPSVGWEGRREGVDDYRYLQLLETVLAAVPAENAAAIQARTWLDELRGKVGWNFYLGNTVGNRRQMDFHNPTPHIPVEEYEDLRDTVTEFILELDPIATKPLKPLARVAPKALAGKYEPAAFVDKSVVECMRGLHSPNVAERRGAARALTLRGGEGAPGVARLVELLDDEDVRFVAFRALEVIGPQAAPAIPALARQLEHPDPSVRLGATFALAGIGPPAVPALERSLADEAWYVAVVALQKVGAMGVDGAPLVQALAQQLKHPNGDRVTWAGAALRDIGPTAAEVLPDLIETVRASISMNARWWTAEALGGLGPAARDAVPVLEKAATDPDQLLRLHARVALFQIAGEEEHLVRLAGEFAGYSVMARQRGSDVLKSLGPGAAPIAGKLREIVQAEKDTYVRRALEALLKEIAEAEGDPPE